MPLNDNGKINRKQLKTIYLVRRMSMLCVRKAEISEIPAVMQFIAEHWKKDHILAVDRDFLSGCMCKVMN